MADIGELIERVGQLEEPSREVDALIEVEYRRQCAYQAGLDDITRAQWAPVGDTGDVEDGGARYASRAYTTSLDAAIALCERVLPGWTWNIGGCPPDFLTDKDKPFGAELMGPISWTVDRETDYPEPEYETASAQRSSPAIAICLALLKALQAQEGDR